MRRIASLLIAIVVSGAPTGSRGAPPPPPPPGSRDFAAEVAKAFNDHDLQAYARLLSSDVQVFDHDKRVAAAAMVDCCWWGRVIRYELRDGKVSAIHFLAGSDFGSTVMDSRPSREERFRRMQERIK